jgi:serine/threonine protein kinase
MSFKLEPTPKPIYLPAGRLFVTKRRKHGIEIQYRIGNGGQGTVFLSLNKNTGKNVVVKIRHPKFANGETIRLLEHQVSQRFHRLSRIFVTPRDLIIQDGFVGYVADYIEGDPIDVIVEKGEIDLIQALIICLRIARNFAALHNLDILHSDIRESNIRIRVHPDGTIDVFVIDWDGMLVPGLPPTHCYGAPRYMAPEILSALIQGKDPVPTKATECYSLAAIFYELIHMRHHLTGHDESPKTIHEVILKGKLIFDPDLPFDPNQGGYPPAILNTRLVVLFRRAFSLDPENRPTAREYEDAFVDALNNVLPCLFCKKPTLVDHLKNTCPHCGNPFPTAKFVAPSGKHIIVNSQEVVIGRADFGGDKTISRTHAYLRKLGPDVFVHVVGKIGMSRKNGKGWETLDSHTLIPVEPGQFLRVGKYEFKLVRCDINGRDV